MLDVVQVGLAPAYVPYLEGWDLQRSVHADVLSGARPDTLLLLEHEAVYTAGVRTQPEDMPKDGTPVVKVDRGGRITWHGPGQLVGYPIVRLRDSKDTVGHVRRLERALIAALSELGVKGMQVDGRSGVWVQPVIGSPAKIAAIGVRVQAGVTMHGFALNCDNAFDGFDGIVPCGIADAGVTSVSEVRGERIAPRDVVDVVSAAFVAEFARAAAATGAEVAA
ncbi:lipoyl(octanoyl) transferase LipB [Microbacterium sp. Root53]|jgi:lipoyl(octanoyl) transferase|uniref:lipoyl(octanoyl) transferase LipB n=1 Tax=Microbacterium sp. Root53 TaxID=1736553 RepID=UPI00070098D0|nr:lipoyl(octanoyl) transferase LipB [Microbacterium sp. Root53]KQY99214.1 octanoyltransferase [Microbacterium sp. Root53]